jgi:hypothetical protein
MILFLSNDLSSFQPTEYNSYHNDKNRGRGANTYLIFTYQPHKRQVR